MRLLKKAARGIVGLAGRAEGDELGFGALGLGVSV